jgi:thiamine pyrophosphate-dependent acetolactate synthase large subunit-like protein
MNTGAPPVATVAEVIANTFRAAGVDLAFGVPGIHNMGLWPDLQDAGITLMSSRHEQGTVYAADGYARATGRLGLALTTTGPGAANAVGAMGEAWASKSPVILLSTDIPASMRRPGVYRGVVHECVDQPALFGPVTKAVVVCERADDAAEATARAVELALSAPCGPVYLQFPADQFAATTDVLARSPTRAEPPAPATSAVDAALDLLAAAERPLIWAGGGARDAGAEVAELALALGAPVLTTFQARGLLPDDHPALVGLPPHEPAVTALIEQADLAIVVGSDLDQMMTQGWRLPLPERRIAVNVDAGDATKNYPMDVVLRTDAALGARALTLADPQRRRWFEDLRVLEGDVLAAIADAEETAEAAEYLQSLRTAIPPEATVFADMAVPGYWASGYHPVHRNRGLHYPMGWGTLGFGFPASIGAAAARRGPVVSLNGDGGMLFAIGELALVVEEALPLTVVVVDDGGYGMLRYGKEIGENRFGTELRSPDFAAIARGFGLTTDTVDGVGADFAAALQSAVAAGRPHLVHARARMTPPRTTSPRWPLRAAAAVV